MLCLLEYKYRKLFDRMKLMDPNKKTDDGSVDVKTSNDGSRVDIYTNYDDGQQHSHDVIHTAADGWTTHDYSRDSDNYDSPSVDAPAYGGNVISGSEQYDDGYPDDN
jgi:hypothetical protein